MTNQINMGASRNIKMAAILAAFPKTQRPSRDKPGYIYLASMPSVALCSIPLWLLFDGSARLSNSRTSGKICSD